MGCKIEMCDGMGDGLKMVFLPYFITPLTPPTYSLSLHLLMGGKGVE
jgi:hypothetical protein